jgi:hypothetical protein
MTSAPAQTLQFDTWFSATWEDFVAIAYAPEYREHRAYFDQGQMRIEMALLGAGHARQNAVVMDTSTISGYTKLKTRF